MHAHPLEHVAIASGTCLDVLRQERKIDCSCRWHNRLKVSSGAKKVSERAAEISEQ